MIWSSPTARVLLTSTYSPPSAGVSLFNFVIADELVFFQQGNCIARFDSQSGECATLFEQAAILQHVNVRGTIEVVWCSDSILCAWDCAALPATKLWEVKAGDPISDAPECDPGVKPLRAGMGQLPLFAAIPDSTHVVIGTHGPLYVWDAITGLCLRFVDTLLPDYAFTCAHITRERALAVLSPRLDKYQDLYLVDFTGPEAPALTQIAKSRFARSQPSMKLFEGHVFVTSVGTGGAVCYNANLQRSEFFDCTEREAYLSEGISTVTCERYMQVFSAFSTLTGSRVQMAAFQTICPPPMNVQVLAAHGDCVFLLGTSHKFISVWSTKTGALVHNIPHAPSNGLSFAVASDRLLVISDFYQDKCYLRVFKASL